MRDGKLYKYCVPKIKKAVKKLTDEVYIGSEGSKTLLVRVEVEGDSLTVIAGDKDFFIVHVRFWGETNCKDERCPAVVYLEVPLLKGGRITLRHPFVGILDADIKYSTKPLSLDEEYIYVDEVNGIFIPLDR